MTLTYANAVAIFDAGEVTIIHDDKRRELDFYEGFEVRPAPKLRNRIALTNLTTIEQACQDAGVKLAR